ncbi:MAG TPA: 2-amino-4-hydroxy-6-hydroxymethyldihydropteridine diphosphokinase [Nitrospirota bacterium]|nr:2-amino-4-hydroxy-6-hydroxymethyldihydropteridine diphosphokinase [Nitrospirota bacterium]
MSIVAYIGLGSNMGDKLATCRRAIEMLGKAGRVIKVSSFYCTEPIGYVSQEDFVNAVVEIETPLSPTALLAHCHVIEDALGRSRLVRWGPRTIDLDILLYGDEIISGAELTIPHPLMAKRAFVLVPLSEIAPEIVHPVLKATVLQLLHGLREDHRVSLCDASVNP